MRCATPNATPVATMSFKKGCHIFKSEKFNGDAPNPHIVLKVHSRPFLYRFRFAFSICFVWVVRGVVLGECYWNISCVTLVTFVTSRGVSRWHEIAISWNIHEWRIRRKVLHVTFLVILVTFMTSVFRSYEWMETLLHIYPFRGYM